MMLLYILLLYYTHQYGIHTYEVYCLASLVSRGE